MVSVCDFLRSNAVSITSCRKSILSAQLSVADSSLQGSWGSDHIAGNGLCLDIHKHHTQLTAVQNSDSNACRPRTLGELIDRSLPVTMIPWPKRMQCSVRLYNTLLYNPRLEILIN